MVSTTRAWSLPSPHPLIIRACAHGGWLARHMREYNGRLRESTRKISTRILIPRESRACANSPFFHPPQKMAWERATWYVHMYMYMATRKRSRPRARIIINSDLRAPSYLATATYYKRRPSLALATARTAAYNIIVHPFLAFARV